VSTAQELVARIQASGVRLALSPQGKLLVSPPGRLQPEVLDTLRRHKQEVFRLLANNTPAIDYRSLYRQMAEAVKDDCWSIDPAWLLDHSEQWEQIRVLDEKLETLEQQGTGEREYQAALNRLLQCVQDVRALCEQETTQRSEPEVQ
jgi:hypothetical protein